MKHLPQWSLIMMSLGLTACATAPAPQTVSVPVVAAPQPIVVDVVTDQLVATTTATVEIPAVVVPRFATEAELKAAETRQKARSSTRTATRTTRKPANTTPAIATPATAVTLAPTESAPVVTSGTVSADQINVGELDDLIAYLVDKAGNYPPRFADQRERRQAVSETKQMIEALDQLVVQPNASFELLMRAVQLNQVARNLDIGGQSAVKAGVYMRRAIALNPEDPAANYWYGTMLTEGGGFKEGIPYLNRAAQTGYKKAYLALAQAYLHIDQRPNALSALESYRIAEPEQQAMATRLIEQIQAGKSNIWTP